MNTDLLAPNFLFQQVKALRNVVDVPNNIFGENSLPLNMKNGLIGGSTFESGVEFLNCLNDKAQLVLHVQECCYRLRITNFMNWNLIHRVDHALNKRWVISRGALHGIVFVGKNCSNKLTPVVRCFTYRKYASQLRFSVSILSKRSSMPGSSSLALAKIKSATYRPNCANSLNPRCPFGLVEVALKSKCNHPRNSHKSTDDQNDRSLKNVFKFFHMGILS